LYSKVVSGHSQEYILLSRLYWRKNFRNDDKIWFKLKCYL
jgi:hypothetical protein